jgi:hypothetical protein
MPVIRMLEADRTTLAGALRATWDLPAGPCTLEFYDGAMPAGGPSEAVGAQVKLGTLTCTEPLGTEAAALPFDPIAQDNAADADGTATWCRLRDGAGVARGDFDVTATAGTGTVKLNTVTIKAGGPIRVTAFVVTMGGA